jgi:very-short-patch-repair endonuclease
MANRMDAAIEAIARKQHGLFTAAQAREAGATAAAVQHRLRSGRWYRVRGGVYRLPGSPTGSRAALMSEILAAGDGAMASHQSAAFLLGLPGYRIDEGGLHVQAGYVNRRRTYGRLHQTLRLPAHHQTVVDWIPCTSVARTLFDLCAIVHPRRAERTLDTALAQRRLTLPAARRVLQEIGARGRGGTALFRALLAERGAGYVAPESELEARFLELLRRHGIPEPHRQVDLGSGDMWIGRVDFLYPDRRLVIELDGAAWHTSLSDKRADAERERRLRERGWTVVRFTWSDVVDHPARVLAALRAAA